MQRAFDKIQNKLQKHGQGGGDGGEPSQQGYGEQQPIGGDHPHHGGGRGGGHHGGHHHQGLGPGPGHQAGATPEIPQPGKREPGPGHLPPKVKGTKYVGPMEFLHPSGKKHDVLCDLGFTGVLDGRVVWTFGDTLMGTEDKNMICATDSTALGHMDAPMTVRNTHLWPNSSNIAEWIPTNKEEEKNGGLSTHAFGGTNIVEVGPNKGLVYYLKNYRPGGNSHIKGAGVATCEMKGEVPHATRHHDTMWTENEPNWGDVGVCYNAQDNHVYAFGHGCPNDGELSARTYLCKVPANHALDISKYRYWDNHAQMWRVKRFTIDGADGTFKLTNDQAIFGWNGMNQSAPFWSNYYNCWMLLYGSSWPYSDVNCKTADKLEGPWHNIDGLVSTKPADDSKGFRYCITAHPEFDPSGKTVLVTWTKDNVIWGVWIEWE